ncbi:hypothetical protein LTR64_000285 [Lithohypha guttulata]|uniref:uncharacterized protein n=1 Tax=Lithohypha guttulata TaxID=1690604 RepID=UPI00315CA3EE
MAPKRRRSSIEPADSFSPSLDKISHTNRAASVASTSRKAGPSKKKSKIVPSNSTPASTPVTSRKARKLSTTPAATKATTEAKQRPSQSRPLQLPKEPVVVEDKPSTENPDEDVDDSDNEILPLAPTHPDLLEPNPYPNLWQTPIPSRKSGKPMAPETIQSDEDEDKDKDETSAPPIMPPRLSQGSLIKYIDTPNPQPIADLSNNPAAAHYRQQRDDLFATLQDVIDPYVYATELRLEQLSRNYMSLLGSVPEDLQKLSQRPRVTVAPLPEFVPSQTPHGDEPMEEELRRLTEQRDRAEGYAEEVSKSLGTQAKIERYLVRLIKDQYEYIEQIAEKLNMPVPKDIALPEPTEGAPIKKGNQSADSGYGSGKIKQSPEMQVIENNSSRPGSPHHDENQQELPLPPDNPPQERETYLSHGTPVELDHTLYTSSPIYQDHNVADHYSHQRAMNDGSVQAFKYNPSTYITTPVLPFNNIKMGDINPGLFSNGSISSQHDHIGSTASTSNYVSSPVSYNQPEIGNTRGFLNRPYDEVGLGTPRSAFFPHQAAPFFPIHEDGNQSGGTQGLLAIHDKEVDDQEVFARDGMIAAELAMPAHGYGFNHTGSFYADEHAGNQSFLGFE